MLALLNFVYIVFKFLRRLNASDQVAESARRETEDILNTVTEGLLLVRADGKLGSQFSASVRKLFMRNVRAGRRLPGACWTACSAPSGRARRAATST